MNNHGTVDSPDYEVIELHYKDNPAKDDLRTKFEYGIMMLDLAYSYKKVRKDLNRAMTYKRRGKFPEDVMDFIKTTRDPEGFTFNTYTSRKANYLADCIDYMWSVYPGNKGDK